jgi:hypothetical protein
MIVVKRQIGKCMIEAHVPDMKAAHKWSAVWGRLPQACTLCGNNDVILFHKSPGGNDYYSLKCNNEKCGAELTLHQFKDDKGFYITDDDSFKIWAGRTDDQGQSDPSPGPASQVQDAFHGSDFSF